MKKETKDLGMEIHPGEGVVKEEKFPHSRKPSDRRVCRKLWNLRWQHNWGVKKKKKKKETHTQNMHLTATNIREVAQTFSSATSEWGLGREHQVALSVLRVRIGLGCPEDNLRKLM